MHAGLLAPDPSGVKVSCQYSCRLAAWQPVTWQAWDGELGLAAALK